MKFVCLPASQMRFDCRAPTEALSGAAIKHGSLGGHLLSDRLLEEETLVMALNPGQSKMMSLAEIGKARVTNRHQLIVERYRKDQIIFSQDDPANAIFFVQKGRVKVTVVSEQGKEAVTAILGANNFFGEGCLAGQPRRMATVTAMTDAVLVRLEKTAIARMIQMEPAFSEMLIAHLSHRNSRIEADLVDQLLNSSEKRLARLLLLLAEFDADGAPGRVIAEINQQMLAEMVGTTRSRVSFFMNKFRKLGLIDYDREIKVHSSLLGAMLDRTAGDQTSC